MPDHPEATDYSTYLLIDELLRLQQPLTPTASDELLFIVVHQAYELWFKLILFELERARDALVETRPQAAVPRCIGSSRWTACCWSSWRCSRP